MGVEAMNRGMKMFGLALALASTVAATAPADAQYYPERRSRVADEIRRGAGQAAEVVGAIAEAARGAEDAVRGAVYSYNFRSPAERYAAEACAVRAERYGRTRIERVYPYKRRSMRVEGIADPRGGMLDSRYGYERRYRPRSFTCTVRDDGSVTRFSTKKLRYRY
jgi:hypothetical protein